MSEFCLACAYGPDYELHTEDCEQGALYDARTTLVALGTFGAALAGPAATEHAARLVDRLLVFDLDEVADLIRRGWQP